MFKFIKWSLKDKVLEGVLIAVAVFDWLQTRNIARHNCTNPETGLHDCYENGIASIFIGNHPSIGMINNYFTASITAHVALVWIMPAKYRTLFQCGTIAIELSFVYHNHLIGISSQF